MHDTTSTRGSARARRPLRRKSSAMSDVAVLGVAFATVIVVVALCATLRPGAAGAMAKALHALAAVFAAAWPWKR